jgi:hypothetical protein
MIPLQPVKLDEAELAMCRSFFQERHGQRLLQYIRQLRPGVHAPTSDERRTQLEKRLGYEELFDNILSTLRPKDAPKTE